jgi:branched-chain amino acid transport system ATP-binding protein
MSDGVILAAENLTKEFKGFSAVEEVNLKVRRGQIHALIDPTALAR